MPSLESLWNSTPFWGIIGLIGGIIVSSVFFLAGKKRKILEYQITSTPLITKNVANISGLKVTINDTPVKTLTSTTIRFFNMGSEKIEPTDFAPLEPLGISVSGSILHLQLRVSADRHYNRNMNLHLEPTDGQTVNIAFDFFSSKKTFSLTVLHEGRLSVLGDLKEGKIRPYRGGSPFLRSFILGIFFAEMIGSVIGAIAMYITGDTLLNSFLFATLSIASFFVIARIILFVSGDNWLTSGLRRLARPYEDDEDDEDESDDF